MMNVKGGTQTWSSAPQQVDFKSDGRQTVGANDKAKFFDNQSIGDTLNKVADPNWVDPHKQMRGVGNNEMGKDAFMKLLLTQMKNQDPTNPMKSHEMAAQLAQFTSLEKLNNINDGIDKLRKENQPDHNFQALAFIGKTITMDNSKITRMNETDQPEMHFDLPSDAIKAKIEIKDEKGNVVRTMDAKNLKAGRNQLVWNGKNDQGVDAPKGDYQMDVEAFGSNGKKLFVQTKAEGVITGVNFTAHGAQLLVGKQAINLADVKSISDPLVQAEAKALATAASQSQPQERMIPIQDPQAQNAQEHSPRKVVVKPEAKPDAAKRAMLSKGSINDSAMTQGLINQLNKSGAKAGMG